MKRINLIKSIVMVLFTFLLIACSDDESDDQLPPVNEEINITDANAVSSSISFKNGDALTNLGDLPAPSSDPKAPKLLDVESEIITLSGKNFSITLDQEFGDGLEGVYLKVEGADDYYDIAISDLNSGGRIGKSENGKVQDIIGTLILSTDSNLSSGSFCISYNAYDVEKRVSNVIKICVDVVKAEFEGSAFLTNNEWQLIYDYYRETVGGTVVYEGTDSIGVDYYDTYTQSVNCTEDSTAVLPITDIDRSNYLYFEFKPNGELITSFQDYSKRFDYDNSTCDELVYDEVTEMDVLAGSWTYDAESEELTTITEYTEFGITKIYGRKNKLDILGDNTLRFSFAEDNSTDSISSIYYYESYLEPKN